MEMKIESKNMEMTTRNSTSNTYRENDTTSNQPQRLTPQQLEERREKGVCFNCDNKYSKGHTCGEKKLFYIECEEEEQKEQELPQGDELEMITPTIPCHALDGINIPQNLKGEGYIKNKKVMVLIVSGITHNFIPCKVAKDLNRFVYLALEFQVLIMEKP